MLLLVNIQQKNWILRLYLIDSLPIPQVESCCDLGILIDDKLSFSAHILSVAKKSSSKSFLIRRCFQSKNPSLLSSAFTCYVCPILEYLSPVWSPYSVKDIDIIENVQRRFTKLFPRLHSLPYPTRSALSYLARFFTPVSAIAGRSQLRSASTGVLFVPRSHTVTIGPRAFAISAPSAWNRLPADLRDPSHSLLTFRKKLKTFLFNAPV